MCWQGRKGKQAMHHAHNSHAPVSVCLNYYQSKETFEVMFSWCPKSTTSSFVCSLPKFGRAHVTLLTLPHSSCQHLTKFFGYLNLVHNSLTYFVSLTKFRLPKLIGQVLVMKSETH
jgi:hypothetical protein